MMVYLIFRADDRNGLLRICNGVVRVLGVW